MIKSPYLVKKHLERGRYDVQYCGLVANLVVNQLGKHHKTPRAIMRSGLLLSHSLPLFGLHSQPLSLGLLSQKDINLLLFVENLFYLLFASQHSQTWFLIIHWSHFSWGHRWYHDLLAIVFQIILITLPFMHHILIELSRTSQQNMASIHWNNIK